MLNVKIILSVLYEKKLIIDNFFVNGLGEILSFPWVGHHLNFA